MAVLLGGRRRRRSIIALPLATVGERLRAVAVRLAYGTGMVVAFAIGSVGAFLVFSWPPLLREIVLGYLFAFLIVRLTLVLGRFLFAPGGERFRIVPMSTGRPGSGSGAWPCSSAGSPSAG